MKILLLNGSPKGEKSDTMHITRSFLAGMNDVSENEIEYIDIMTKHIEYCTGCLLCMKNGGRCIQNDDMQEILKMIIASNLLLFSFPLYCYGIPAPLKALLDRTMPLSTMAMQKVGDRYEHVGQADYSHIRYCVISGCGFPNAKHNFEALLMGLEMMFCHDLFTLTIAEAPLFNAPEAVSVTAPFLELIRSAGREYALNGKVSLELMKKLAMPMIPENVYADICSGK